MKRTDSSCPRCRLSHQLTLVAPSSRPATSQYKAYCKQSPPASSPLGRLYKTLARVSSGPGPRRLCPGFMNDDRPGPSSLGRESAPGPGPGADAGFLFLSLWLSACMWSSRVPERGLCSPVLVKPRHFRPTSSVAASLLTALARRITRLAVVELRNGLSIYISLTAAAPDLEIRNSRLRRRTRGRLPDKYLSIAPDLTRDSGELGLFLVPFLLGTFAVGYVFGLEIATG